MIVFIKSSDDSILIFSVRSNGLERKLDQVRKYIGDSFEIILTLQDQEITLEHLYDILAKDRKGANSECFHLTKKVRTVVNHLKEHPQAKLSSKWTIDKIEYLKKNYPMGRKKDLQKELGFSWGAIRVKACKLGIRKKKHH